MSTPHPSPFLDESKALACVHCGLCLGACPTYLETGNENESPRGRIYLMRAMQEGRVAIEAETVKHIDLCLGCRACEVACPSGVQYGALLESTRDHIEETYSRGPAGTFLRRIVIEKIFPYPARMKLALLPAKFLKALHLEKFLPKNAREALELVPRDANAFDVPEFSAATNQPARGRVGFIRGCVMPVMFGKTNRATVELLNRAGYDVTAPKTQVCCGALHAHSGRMEKAREFARANIRAFSEEKLEAIIINAAGCGSTLKEYGHLLEHDREWHEAGAQFSTKVKDITEFLVEGGFASRQFRPSVGLVTYHDACHLAHPQRITKPPRQLVKAVARGQFVELPESDLCCGSAGTYNLTQPAMAERLQERKIENILKTSATVVVTTNPGCILQMQAGLAKAGRGDIRVVHIADFLMNAL